jgi:hypothetical protein
MVIPHPLKAGWLEIGRYDQTWPAVNRTWCLMRDGMPRAMALAAAAKEFGIAEQSIVNWLNRTRRHGHNN